MVEVRTVKTFFLFTEFFFWETAKATRRHSSCRFATCRESNTFRSYLWVQATVWTRHVFLIIHNLLPHLSLTFNKSSISCVCVIPFVLGCARICVHPAPQVDDEGELFHSLDDGHTRFSDLIQLVEFYQLNRGVLPCKLKHHCARITLWTGDPRPPRAHLHLYSRAVLDVHSLVSCALKKKDILTQQPC